MKVGKADHSMPAGLIVERRIPHVHVRIVRRCGPLANTVFDVARIVRPTATIDDRRSGPRFTHSLQKDSAHVT